MFEPFKHKKLYFCCIPCNGYKCFLHKQNDKLGTVLKTTIYFVYTVEGIDYLVGVYTLESSSQVSKLWFEDELISSKHEQYSVINNYLPILQEYTRILSSCWSESVCFNYA